MSKLEDFEKQFVADCVAHERPVVIETNVSMCLTLIGQLQLALRHPGNKGASAKEARRFVEALIDQIAVTETIRKGLEMGWDSHFDQPRKENPT